MTDSNLTTAYFEPREMSDEPTVSLEQGMVLNNKYQQLDQIGRGGMGWELFGSRFENSRCRTRKPDNGGHLWRAKPTA